jgi:choline kinase
MNKCSAILLNAIPDKKVKSLGNRCLWPIKSNKTILDYHIYILKQIFTSPEIILIDSYDCKKTQKYLSKYKNIKYVQHPITDTTNIGTSIKIAIENISNNSCFFLNTNHIIHKKTIAKIKSSLNDCFVLTANDQTCEVGYITNKNNNIINCYYDLPNSIFDVMYFHKKYFNRLSQHSQSISKLYMFETINHYINNGINIKPLIINSKNITLLNNNKNIKNIEVKLCVK